MIEELKKQKYFLTDEGSLSAYLGIKMEKKGLNQMSLTQPAFIKRIINSVNLKDQWTHNTPADSVLNRYLEGQGRKTDFHYRSTIGQLNYLASTTQHNIQFAVHQCARFLQNLKMSH